MSASPVRQLVAIGSSAGGIETLSALVATLPSDLAAPIVVAQHLDPTRPSHLQSILARHSTLPVRTVTNREPLENGVVYVVPSNQHISISDHHLSIDTDSAGRPKPSIDLLFRTAAEIFGESLIAVVLSGLGSDGSAGARYVKERGGTVVIQNPHTAPYPSMPQSLGLATVDVVADADVIGPILHDLLSGSYIPEGPGDNRELRIFLADLHRQSGIDFGQYKPATIQRRLQRRLVATGTRSLGQYRAYLGAHPEEYERLIAAFLIKVTEFFRDIGLFNYLRDTVLPELIEHGRASGNILRIWSAGCATGEEGYSLAILVAEALNDDLVNWNIRIFATDLDREAVEFGRRGLYPASALLALPVELRDRYLTEGQGQYQVSKPIRSLLVFGEHDLGQRPPFPNIDLCLCRNVLIYFTPELQRRSLEVFAFALRNGGYLALGKAETAGSLPGHFVPAELGLRVYRREGDRMILPHSTAQAAVSRINPGRSVRPTPAAQELEQGRHEVQQAQQSQLVAEDLLLRLPIGVVVVDPRYTVQRINAVARRQLGIYTPALGEDLVHLARTLPAQHLREAIDTAASGTMSTLENLPNERIAPGETSYIRITCLPHQTAQVAGRVMLVITDVSELVRANALLAEERAELARLRVTVEQLGNMYRTVLAANEDLAHSDLLLRQSNEEYMLGNEVIQAATEEVETLNEELQATNEELETLNEEQQATVEELETTNEELRARSQEAHALALTVDEQRQWLAVVLDSMGDALVVMDRQGNTTFTNALFDQLMELTGGSFVAQDADGHPLPTEDAPQQQVQAGKPFQMEFTLVLVDGQRRWYEATARPINADGQTQEMVLVLRDSTDRTLRRLQDEFLALASHELRTPLTSIRGYIELLDRGIKTGKDPERLREQAARAREQTTRLNSLVNDLLDVGRLSGGALHLQSASFDLRQLVVHLGELSGVIAPERRIDFEVPDEPVTIVGDASRLEQVLLNLLNNAVTHAPDSAIMVRLQRDAKFAVVEVIDHGPGIPVEALPSLFTRFYQIEQSSRDRGSGLGLGLYIAREIVQAHGGSVAVYSVVGEGSTFTVRLPLASSADDAASSETP